METESTAAGALGPNRILAVLGVGGLGAYAVQYAREYTYHGSFWGNDNDLSEVISLARQGKIRHAVKTIRFEDINKNLDLLRTGDMVGRAVVTY